MQSLSFIKFPKTSFSSYTKVIKFRKLPSLNIKTFSPQNDAAKVFLCVKFNVRRGESFTISNYLNRKAIKRFSIYAQTSGSRGENKTGKNMKII